MIYSDLFLKKQPRVPSIFIVPFVLLIVGILTYYFVPAQTTQASKKSIQKVEVVNLYPSHVGIAWQTSDKDSSWLMYGTRLDKLDKVVFDERDAAMPKKPRNLHFAELKNLTPSTKYYIRMTDGNVFLQNGNEGVFSITTAPKDAQINNLKPAYGKLVGRNGAPVPGALITITIPNSYVLATLSKSNGEWLIPMNYIINRTTNKSHVIDQNQEVILRAVDDTKTQSLVRTRLSLMSPLGENIVLGENYELNSNNQVLAANTSSKNYKLAILFPKNSSVIPSEKPLIKGVSSSDIDVKIDVLNKQKAKIISATVHSNDKGEWKYDVPTALNPGTYTLSATSVDSSTRRSGTITHTFLIAKSGEQVLGDATGGATLTPSPTVAVTSTPTATPPTTITESPSPTLVASASATPVASVSATITTTPPVSGITDNNIVLSSIAFILLGLGLLVVFK